MFSEREFVAGIPAQERAELSVSLEPSESALLTLLNVGIRPTDITARYGIDTWRIIWAEQAINRSINTQIVDHPILAAVYRAALSSERYMPRQAPNAPYYTVGTLIQRLGSVPLPARQAFMEPYLPLVNNELRGPLYERHIAGLKGPRKWRSLADNGIGQVVPHINVERAIPLELTILEHCQLPDHSPTPIMSAELFVEKFQAQPPRRQRRVVEQAARLAHTYGAVDDVELHVLLGLHVEYHSSQQIAAEVSRHRTNIFKIRDRALAKINPYIDATTAELANPQDVASLDYNRLTSLLRQVPAGHRPDAIRWLLEGYDQDDIKNIISLMMGYSYEDIADLDPRGVHDTPNKVYQSIHYWLTKIAPSVTHSEISYLQALPHRRI